MDSPYTIGNGNDRSTSRELAPPFINETIYSGKLSQNGPVCSFPHLHQV